jgi:hypothetical protein
MIKLSSGYLEVRIILKYLNSLSLTLPPRDTTQVIESSSPFFKN